MAKVALSPDINIDIQRLVETRMLLQANSGGGKSYAIRKLCEATYGGAQQLIIDVDGEYHTLREKFDYVLAGQKGADCPADVKSAALLARRLLELNVSAIIDIYELGAQRSRFVKLFLEAMMLAPKDLWHPVLVVIDEAHMFCPEKDKAESTGAVIDLMTRGRKRGFCGVLATQRIAKLNKDAAAECNNKLIGRCGLDVDMKRAGAELGFAGREDLLKLRTMKPGEFYAFGPALSDLVVITKVGAVATSHLRAGQRAVLPAPPRARVKKLLAQLADLPHEAEEEAKTVAELRVKNRQLAAELAKRPEVKPGKTVTKETKVAVFDPKQVARIEKLVTRLSADTERLDSIRDQLAQAQQAVVSEIDNLKRLAKMQVEKTVVNTLPSELHATARQLHSQQRLKIGAPQLDAALKSIGPRRSEPVAIGKQQFTMGAGRKATSSALPRGEAAILTALIQYPNGLTGKQLSVITGYVQQSRDTYVSALVGRNLAARDRPGHVIALQPAASEALPVIKELPTGPALQDYWLGKLSKGEAAIFRVIVDAYPEAVQGASITEQTGYVQQSRDTYISKMVGKEIVERVSPGWIRASDALFE
jgi:hypothetical protein